MKKKTKIRDFRWTNLTLHFSRLHMQMQLKKSHLHKYLISQLAMQYPSGFDSPLIPYIMESLPFFVFIKLVYYKRVWILCNN